MELTNFAGALEALIESGADNYGDCESMEELERLSSRFEAFRTEATAAFEAGEAWAADGAKTAASWLSARCRVSRAAAKRRVRLGRTLRHLPAVAEAWRDGAIGGDAASAIASARRHRTEASMDRDEAMLVAQAAELGFDDFYRVLEYWKQMADPDGADASEEERTASRNVYLETSLSGMWLGQITLDPISGSIVATELNRLEHDLFEADCAEAKERLGRTGRIDELARTSGQRRADALVEMATRSRTAPAEGIRPAPLFSVFVGYETMHGRICELENGTVLAPVGARPLDGLGLFRAGPVHAGQPGRRQCALPVVHRWDQKGHRAAGPDLHPPLLLRTRRELPGRSHSDLRRRRRDHPGQRAAALRLPQPPPEPARAPRRPAPAATAERSLTGRPPPGPVRPGQHPGRCMAGTLKSDDPGALARPPTRSGGGECTPAPTRSGSGQVRMRPLEFDPVQEEIDLLVVESDQPCDGQ